MQEHNGVNEPRNFANGNRPGAYRLASVLRESVLDPGDTIELDQYITGYGECSGFKITSYPSNELFIEDESFFEHGLEETTDEPRRIVWGGTKGKISNGGISISPARRFYEPWRISSTIFDLKENTNYLLSERSTPKPPFAYKIKLKKNAPPGPHYINFYLTFYNGSEWICQEERVNFKINNKFEQYSNLLSWAAAVALIVTISHDGLSPVFDSIHELGKWISQFRNH